MSMYTSVALTYTHAQWEISDGGLDGDDDRKHMVDNYIDIDDDDDVDDVDYDDVVVVVVVFG